MREHPKPTEQIRQRMDDGQQVMIYPEGMIQNARCLMKFCDRGAFSHRRSVTPICVKLEGNNEKFHVAWTHEGWGGPDNKVYWPYLFAQPIMSCEIDILDPMDPYKTLGTAFFNAEAGGDAAAFAEEVRKEMSMVLRLPLARASKEEHVKEVNEVIRIQMQGRHEELFKEPAIMTVFSQEYLEENKIDEERIEKYQNYLKEKKWEQCLEMEIEEYYRRHPTDDYDFEEEYVNELFNKNSKDHDSHVDDLINSAGSATILKNNNARARFSASTTSTNIPTANEETEYDTDEDSAGLLDTSVYEQAS